MRVMLENKKIVEVRIERWQDGFDNKQTEFCPKCNTNMVMTLRKDIDEINYKGDYWCLFSCDNCGFGKKGVV